MPSQWTVRAKILFENDEQSIEGHFNKIQNKQNERNFYKKFNVKKNVSSQKGWSDRQSPNCAQK